MRLTICYDRKLKGEFRMMKHNEKRKRKVSGFTLLEMVVVLAIISVLTGILVPTVRGYITRSRINTANSNAKVLFNSIQTIMMEFQFKERTMTESAFYGTEIYNLTGNDKVFFYVKGENGVIKRIRTFVVSAEEEDGRND